MNRRTVRSAFFIVIMSFLLPACFSLQAKKPSLKGTCWTGEHKMFVADAGTMTETYTLEFISGKECILTNSWVLPAHPAMYMNADGTVDTIPESRSESSSRATWRYRRGEIILTFEDGSTRTLHYLSSRISETIFSSDEIIYERVR